MNPRVRRGLLATLRTIFSVGHFLVQRDASLLAAGLAFFAMVSLAPFIVLAVAIGGALFGAEAARAELYTRIADEVGPQVATLVTDLAQNAADTRSLSVATLVSLLLLLWSSTRLLMEVRRALHLMWQIPAPAELTLRTALFDYLRARLFSALGTLIFGTLFLALISSRLVLKLLADALASGTASLSLPDSLIVTLTFIEPIFSFLVLTTLIIVIFRLLPTSGPRRAPLWIGAATAALLMLAGRSLVSAYISAGAIDTAYGAAGSAMVFLILAYWASLAFLFGARLAHALDTLWFGVHPASAPPPKIVTPSQTEPPPPA